MTVLVRDIGRPDLVPTTAPTEEPISVAEAKDQMRVTQSSEDAYIGLLIQKARDKYENDIQFQLVTASRKTTLDKFPNVIVLAFPPLQADNLIITYVDEDGADQTLASTEYQLDTKRIPGEVVEAFDKTWPATRDQRGAVTVAYNCGYGDASAVPFIDKHAVALLVAHWFANRESPISGATITGVPTSYDDIVNQRRLDRWDL